ncbi:DUF4224 domain-containing protein [Comamonas terrae]|uniref:DUF4224 domain-containing protein n=1 Tax=Comamonas terrae TaxID=673548 RepID=A0ABW5UQQ7_9BURK|nr:DUF4224 domain-containing protein [Comamonas terrae]
MNTNITLSEQEIADITGYRQPARQLAQLLALGFFRARISRSGRVLLERAHYDAVCTGATSTSMAQQPQLRKPSLRLAT